MFFLQFSLSSPQQFHCGHSGIRFIWLLNHSIIDNYLLTSRRNKKKNGIKVCYLKQQFGDGCVCCGLEYCAGATIMFWIKLCFICAFVSRNEWIFGEWMQWNWNASTQNIWCVDQTEKNAFYWDVHLAKCWMISFFIFIWLENRQFAVLWAAKRSIMSIWHLAFIIQFDRGRDVRMLLCI